MAKRDPFESQKFPVYEVIWDDPASNPGWKPIRKHQDDPDSIRCRTVGYLTVKTKKVVQVVQSTSENGNAADAMCIPRSCVKRMRRLR